MDFSLEILKDPVFWSDVGLATASRLAVAAMLLWVMKMMFERHFDRGQSPLATQPPVPAGRETITPVPRMTLHRGPEKPVTVGAAEPDEPISNRRRDELRERLLKYVEQRSTERLTR